MGGFGSGRRRTQLGVEECRALEIGELGDEGRRRSQPRGEVLWRSKRDGRTRGRLSYAISEIEGSARLSYRYAPEGGTLTFAGQVVLAGGPGRRTLACCPACGRSVRTLYAPPRAYQLRCRSCWGLVYRRPQWREQLASMREVAGPTLAELEALPKRVRPRPRRRYVAAPPAALAASLAEELPLGAEELRLWCLRLRAAGLSYRQIAALTESSKSSVARICADGPKAIDAQALVRERLERDAVGPPAPQDDDPAALGAYLHALHRHSLRLGLYRLPATEPDERVVVAADADLES